jgi:hypothetical protein
LAENGIRRWAMEKATIRLVQVPSEFRAHSRNEEYICHHLYSKVAGGTTILDEEIYVCGFRRDHPGDDNKVAVLCLDCVKGFSRKDRGYEIVAWPVQGGPIEESALFKDVMKN